jgi:hypothetical protein
MALLWMDGFDHYGLGTTGRNNMTSYGAYATSTGTIATDFVRTGAYAYKCGASSNSGFRRTFGTMKSSVGVGFPFYLPSLPSNTHDAVLAAFWDNSGNVLITIFVNPSGFIEVWSGKTPGLGLQQAITSSQVVTPGAWAHFECYFVPNAASSAIEIRINQVTVINDASIVIGTTTGEGASSTETSSVNVMYDTLGANYFYVDDLFAWDTSGSFNNDFLGDKKVHTIMPNGDTATADWALSTGSLGYAVIDEIPPNGDTDYLYSVTSGAESAFDLEAMPSNTGAVNGLQVYRATKKTDAGTCDVRTEIVSGASTATGATQPATTAYQYYTDIFETDPATGVLWTKAGVDAAKVKLNRIA